MAYNDANEYLGESFSRGTLDSVAVTVGYDAYLRRNSLSAARSLTTLHQDSLGYDTAGRLQMVTDNTSGTTYSGTYSYVANSPLVSQIAFKQSTTPRMTTTKNWDLAHEISEFASRIGLRSSEDEAVMRVSDSTISRAEIRLTSVSSTANSTVVSSSAYQLNSANQRVAVTNADGSYWVYGYDNLGQVTSGKKYWSDNTPVAGQQFEYTFDDIGNRTQMGTSIEGCKCHGMCL